jgi:Protein of unknown function (DUF3105)
MRRVAHFVRLAAMLAIVGFGLASMQLLPGVHLTAGARAVVACDKLPGRAVAGLPPRHLSYLGQTHAPYTSSPPTSGPHMPWLISPGVYDKVIPDEYQVHLLEHGKVIVQYPVDAPDAVVDAVERITQRRVHEVVSAPSRALRHGIALTAWQRIERLPRFDRDRVQAFADALAGRYSHGWSAGAADCVPG